MPEISVRERAAVFYRSHLRKYAFFRLLRISLSRFGWYACGIRFATRRAIDRVQAAVKLCLMPPADRAAYLRVRERIVGDFRLVPISKFTDGVVDRTTLLPAESRVYRGASFFGPRPAAADENFSTIRTPEVILLRVEGATAAGKCDAFLYRNQAVISDQLNLERDLLVEEMSGAGRADVGRRRLHLRIESPIRYLEVPHAISLLGGATQNYVHWLIETLPKLLLLDRCPQFRELPLLVDTPNHPNIFEALDFFNVHRRELIKVERLQPVRTEQLLFISPPSYVPIDHRRAKFGAPSQIRAEDVMHSASGIAAIQRFLLDALPPSSVRRKLYLRRNTTFRQILNAPELEAMLTAAGFETIEPDRLTFRQQVDLFHTAGCIVAQCGAALGNLCLTPPGCFVIPLIANSSYINYRYFDHLATILGHKLVYIAGEAEVSASRHPSHADFRINPQDLAEALRAVSLEFDARKSSTTTETCAPVAAQRAAARERTKAA